MGKETDVCHNAGILTLMLEFLRRNLSATVTVLRFDSCRDPGLRPWNSLDTPLALQPGRWGGNTDICGS